MAKLHFLYSVMNAGKTTHLLQVRHNYVENGGRVLLFTSIVDDRAGVGRVASRLGIGADATPLRAEDDLFAIVDAERAAGRVTAVLIDECQFLTAAHIRQAARVADELDVPVMCYGLKNNYRGELFGEAVAALLALADDLQEWKQLCWCEKKATQVIKYDAAGRQILSGAVVEVGGEDRYVSVCRKHWSLGDIGHARRAALAGTAF